MTTAITYEQEEAPLYIVEGILGRMEQVTWKFLGEGATDLQATL